MLPVCPKHPHEHNFSRNKPKITRCSIQKIPTVIHIVALSFSPCSSFQFLFKVYELSGLIFPGRHRLIHRRRSGSPGMIILGVQLPSHPIHQCVTGNCTDRLQWPFCTGALRQITRKRPFHGWRKFRAGSIVQVRPRARVHRYLPYPWARRRGY